MADTKISELPIATSIASPDVSPVVQGGVTKQADVALFGVGSQLSVTFHSSGDTNDGNFPFTADNAQIRAVDVNGVDILSIYTGGNADNSGNLFISDSLPSAGPSSQDNVIIGFDSMVNITADAFSNVAIATGALRELTTGSGNTCIGYHAGQTIQDGSDNVVIGSGADILEPSGSSITLIGAQVDSGIGVTDNAIGIGTGKTITNVAANNTIVIGNSFMTDANFFNAILHGKGDAIVFPDSDPHVAGAAYWVLGVLTRSAG